MRIVDKPITLAELKTMAADLFGNLVKAVVDIERGAMAIDAQLHSDLEALLLEQGSRQKDIWGINLYPDLTGDAFIEFDSMINLRPVQGNMSRGVDNEKIRKKIEKVVARWIAQ